MAQIDCPDCPRDLDSRGAFTHLTQKHGWGDDEAKTFVRERTSDEFDRNDPDGGSPPNSAEISRETPDSQSNSPDDQRRDTDSTEISRETPDSQSNSGEPVSDPDPDPDAIQVSEEGKDKLSPSGFERESRSEMEPPGDELPSDVGPDDLEPETVDAESGENQRETPDAQSNSVESADATDEESDDPESDDSEDEDGFIDKLRNRDTDETDEQRSTEEIIDDAPTEEKRDRRRRLKEQLEQQTSDESESDPDRSETRESSESRESSRETPEPQSNSGSDVTTTNSGLVMSDTLMKMFVGMPFNQADKFSEWDGWALDSTERDELSELIEAYAREKDVELSPEMQLLFGIGNIVGGKAARYGQWKRQQNNPSGDDEPELKPADSGERERQTRESQSNPSQRRQADPSEGETETFDFDSPGFGRNQSAGENKA